jgi:hypothetical protein
MGNWWERNTLWVKPHKPQKGVTWCISCNKWHDLDAHRHHGEDSFQAWHSPYKRSKKYIANQKKHRAKRPKKKSR